MARNNCDAAATCKPYLQVRSEGERQIRQSLKHYTSAHGQASIASHGEG